MEIARALLLETSANVSCLMPIQNSLASRGFADWFDHVPVHRTTKRLMPVFAGHLKLK
jgi:hypothetical protein